MNKRPTDASQHGLLTVALATKHVTEKEAGGNFEVVQKAMQGPKGSKKPRPETRR